jgi:transketolase
MDDSTGDRQGSNGGGWSRAGRNLHFGVREHAMAAICNGIAAHGGAIPFNATFFVFSDYLRPALRLSSMMGLQVVYVFTHDSIALGEDGATHQPIEHLASLRAMPGLVVIRPADANETAEAWRVAVESAGRPVALVLTRQHLPTLDRNLFAPADGLRRGAYVLSEAEGGDPQLLLIATGSEVGLALEAQAALREHNVHARVVSMPSWELFDEQPQEYRDQVLPPALTARLAIEAGVAQGWHRYVGDRGDVLSIEDFGASAPGDKLLREYGYSVENVLLRAQAVLGKNKQ